MQMEHTLIHQGYQGTKTREVQVGLNPKGNPVGISNLKLVIIISLLFLLRPGLRDRIEKRRRRFYNEWNKLLFAGLFSDSFLPVIEC